VPAAREQKCGNAKNSRSSVRKGGDGEKMQPAEGIARPMTLRIATIVTVLAAGDTAKAVAIRTIEVTTVCRRSSQS
jgi:hypothetical protein